MRGRTGKDREQSEISERTHGTKGWEWGCKILTPAAPPECMSLGVAACPGLMTARHAAVAQTAVRLGEWRCVA
jgi:hypothetical protein